MACYGNEEPKEPDSYCDHCGSPTFDGISTESCSYSHEECVYCENKPCDGSC